MRVVNGEISHRETEYCAMRASFTEENTKRTARRLSLRPIRLVARSKCNKRKSNNLLCHFFDFFHVTCLKSSDFTVQ
ncbi:unnamed protein product [Caenorhabditis brenneri]